MTEMQFYGLAIMLSSALVVLSLVLRGQTVFVWSVALTLVAFGVAVLAMTSIPATLAASLLGESSIKVVPASPPR